MSCYVFLYIHFLTTFSLKQVYSHYNRYVHVYHNFSFDLSDIKTNDHYELQLEYQNIISQMYIFAHVICWVACYLLPHRISMNHGWGAMHVVDGYIWSVCLYKSYLLLKMITSALCAGHNTIRSIKGTLNTKLYLPCQSLLSNSSHVQSDMICVDQPRTYYMK